MKGISLRIFFGFHLLLCWRLAWRGQTHVSSAFNVHYWHTKKLLLYRFFMVFKRMEVVEEERRPTFQMVLMSFTGALPALVTRERESVIESSRGGIVTGLRSHFPRCQKLKQDFPFDLDICLFNLIVCAYPFHNNPLYWWWKELFLGLTVHWCEKQPNQSNYEGKTPPPPMIVDSIFSSSRFNRALQTSHEEVIRLTGHPN